MRRLAQNNAALIDCRFEEEWELWRLKNARLIPLEEIRVRARGLDKAREYIVYCRSGRRSRAAAFLMRQAGLNALSLAGRHRRVALRAGRRGAGDVEVRRRGREPPHLPMQNRPKISARTSSASTRPVMRPSAVAARRRSSARNSRSAGAPER